MSETSRFYPDAPCAQDVPDATASAPRPWPAPTIDAWERRVLALTGGAPQALRRRLPSDLYVEPLYPEGAVRPVVTRGRSWTAALPHAWDETLPEQLEHDARFGLERAWVVPPLPWRTGAVALDPVTLAVLDRARRVAPDVALAIDSGSAGATVLAALADTEEAAKICVWADPLGAWARVGRLDREIAVSIAETARSSAAADPSRCRFLADGTPYRDAGASALDELAWIVATGLEYVRALESAGLATEDAIARVGFRVVVGPHLFEELAKLRALRWLWTMVGARMQVQALAAIAPIVARTGWRNRSLRDPWANLLRATTEATAAVLGGCDELAVLPLTHATAEHPAAIPAGAAHRWALDVQHLLRNESHLHEIEDPAAGSGVVEALTDALARGAWARVQAIEADGGMSRALATGVVARTVTSNREREAQVLPRLVGVTLYPPDATMAGETVAEQEPVTEAWPRGHEPTITALVPDRLAVPFERVQQVAHGFARTRGVRPRAGVRVLGDRSALGPALHRSRRLLTALGLDACELGPDTEPPDHAALLVICATSDALVATDYWAVVGATELPVWLVLERTEARLDLRGDWAAAMVIDDSAVAWRTLAEQVAIRLESMREQG